MPWACNPSLSQQCNAGWMVGSSFDYHALTPGTSFSVGVAVTLSLRGEQPFSDPAPFHTRLAPEQFAAMRPMWAPNASAEYVLLRRQVAAPASNQTFLLASTHHAPT